MITGASKGLEAALAKELAGRGMNLVLVARSVDMLRDGIDTVIRRSGLDGATLRPADDFLCPPPLPAGCDPARGLALPALHLELPRC